MNSHLNKQTWVHRRAQSVLPKYRRLLHLDIIFMISRDLMSWYRIEMSFFVTFAELECQSSARILWRLGSNGAHVSAPLLSFRR